MRGESSVAEVLGEVGADPFTVPRARTSLTRDVLHDRRIFARVVALEDRLRSAVAVGVRRETGRVGPVDSATARQHPAERTPAGRHALPTDSLRVAVTVRRDGVPVRTSRL